MALRKRLLRDIAELQEKPYPNISYVPHGDDLTKACLILTIDKERLHLTVNLSNNYPLDPPKISIQTVVSHPNVFGNYICASILNTTEGYTPAYDLKGICIQILSFFASETIEQEHGLGTVRISGYTNDDFFSDICRELGVVSSNYKCKHCDFADLPVLGQADRHHQDTAHSCVHSDFAVARPLASGRYLLSNLPDELLANICEKLSTEELTSFARAWDHIGGEEGIVNKFNIIRNREIMCFCLKEAAVNVQLGIGVSFRQKSFESEFDLLSLQAFHEFGIRRSVQGLHFTHWMPLPITRPHYGSIKDLVIAHLQDLAQTMQSATPVSPEGVLYAFMNDIIVRLCNQAESGYSRSSLIHASEKAIGSYYHLFHLLLCLAIEDDNIRRTANRKIKDFLIEGRTSKADIPNLGHLLVAILISDAEMTNDLLLAIIRETVTRNVVWMLDSRGANMPELAYMEEDAISHYRLQKTFDASKTSYRLLMFLNLFRKTVNRGTSTGKKTLVQASEELFDAHGAPPRGTAARLAGDIKALQNVKNFPEFIKIMGLAPPPASNFTTFLRNCVEDSMRKGYSVWGVTQTKALNLRQIKDPGVQVRKDQKPEWSSQGGFGVSFFPNKHGKKYGGKR